MSTELSTAWELFASGDPKGAMRALRSAAEHVPPGETAALMAELSRPAGFDDLGEASRALVERPDGVKELYAFAIACIGRGVSEAAVPALRQAQRSVTGGGRRAVVVQLAVALEDLERHAAAVTALREQDAVLADWPDRYLLVHNALMDGQPALAREVFGRLSEPADARWRPAADRVRRTFARAADAAPAGNTDLRGWHFTLTGGLLCTLSPHGFRQGMTGRWAFAQDSLESCRYGLERLRVVLAATGRWPASVGLLPDRGSQVLGLAAARLLGLPAAPYRPGTADALVVAYDLTRAAPELLPALRERAPREVLFEHATCWTRPPAVSADVNTLLVQTVIAPWEAQLRFGPERERVPAVPDPRPAAELAEAVCAAPVAPQEGDGETPPDPDELLAAFAARVRGTWLTGPRDRVNSPGPVRSSRFA
ncbi:hypothetical protein OG552_28795 [Streptomyces sp. NBC_01476]|uniref:hypothetical protein n=1 Tax=Streptomyces sp. NBC_01476 TaxID=2903881 RepID=UPI002E323228|nr:hypothetical protein [Streptomyces sp. NBC_01476]